jgi:hypothetical protein
MAEQSSGLGSIAPEARAMIAEMYNGENMKKLALQRVSAREALEAQGQIKPCTVINWNPVQLKLENAHAPWTIPPCTDKSAKTLKIEFEGKKYTGSYMTIREPAFVAWIRDVKKPTDDSGNPTAEYDAKFVLPLEIADQYHLEYNTSEKQNLMGGVLVFEGDVHAFKKALGAKAAKILVPKYRTLSDRTRTYFAEEVDLVERLKLCLDTQKATCQSVIQKGDEYDQDDNERKNITSPMRAWAQFSLDMGWKQNAPPWMNAQLDSEESCKGCGRGKKKTGAHFCECGRPFNAYEAFMAGENVPESYLFALKGKELDQVMEELGKREALKAKFRPKA